MLFRSLRRILYQHYPTITVIDVAATVETVRQVLLQISYVIQFLAGFSTFAGIVILASAIAGTRYRRIREVVVLKTLGATRRTLITAFSLEYMLIGLATAIFALVAGGIAAWFVVARIMTLPSSFQPEVALATIIVALAFTVGIGLLGTWRVLGQKAAPVLRNL